MARGGAGLVSGSGALSNLPSNDVPNKKPEVILAAILVVLPVLLSLLGEPHRSSPAESQTIS